MSKSLSFGNLQLRGPKPLAFAYKLNSLAQRAT